MKLADAKAQFISSWGAIATQWGIPRAMGLIHGLLLISPKPLSTEDIMEHLGISRGNCNQNVRELISWGLVQKINFAGDRKEYFTAEKDLWTVCIQVMKERRKRELEPVIKLAASIGKIDGAATLEAKAFTEMIAQLSKFSLQADKAMEIIIKSNKNPVILGVKNLFR